MSERKAERVLWGGKERWGCVDKVFQSGAFRSSKCGKRAKHDPDADGNPTKCGIHCAEAVARRRAKSDAKYAEYRARLDRDSAIRKLNSESVSIVRQIAAGHNDPRALSSEWVERMDALLAEASQ